MNRRDFGKTASLMVAAVISPNVLAKEPEDNPYESERVELASIGWNQAQIEAWMRMRQFERRLRSLYSKVAQEFPRIGRELGNRYWVTWFRKNNGTSGKLRRI